MKFSNVDVITQEKSIIANRAKDSNISWFGRLFNIILYPKNPKYTFSFHIPNYLFIRSISFCDEVAADIGTKFDTGDLANALYLDFLEYVRKTNDLNKINDQLKARGILPTKINPYSTEQAYTGVIFEEYRAFDTVKTIIAHKDALRGEYLLHDMLEYFPNHGYILENILECVYCNFVDDYRKGLIKNPIEKVVQYLG